MRSTSWSQVFQLKQDASNQLVSSSDILQSAVQGCEKN